MKKVFKILPYIILIVAGIFIYDLYFENKSFKDQIRDLNKDKDSLGLIISDNNKTITDLIKKAQITQIKYDSLYIKLNEKKDETNNVIDIVYSLDERQLDSTIRAYKHIKRK